MRLLGRLLPAAFVLMVCSGFFSTPGCKREPVVVSTELGPENQQLVDDLKAQVGTLQEQIKNKDDLIDQAAGNAHGIDIGVEHIEEESRGKEVVRAENDLLRQTVGEPSDARRAESAARTLAILQNDLEAQKELYGRAVDQIEQRKKEIDEKQQAIDALGQKLVEQEELAKKEREAAAKKLSETITGFENEIQNMKDEQAKKERRMWINVLRYGGFGIIVIGIIALAVTQGKMIIPAGILIASGSLVILIGLSIDILTSQSWFPVAAGIVGVLVVAGFCGMVYHFYRTHVMMKKSVAVINDMKTEADTLIEHGQAEEGNKIKERLDPHLDYRFGSNDSRWGKVLHKTFVQEGLDEKQKAAT